MVDFAYLVVLAELRTGYRTTRAASLQGAKLLKVGNSPSSATLRKGTQVVNGSSGLRTGERQCTSRAKKCYRGELQD